MKRDDDWLVTVFEPDRWTLPTDPAQVGRIMAEVHHRRRRRLAVRAGAGVVAAGLVATMAVVLVNSDLGKASGPRQVTFLSQPQTTGPLPEPQVRQISGLDELTGLLPGITVTEHDVGSFDPVGMAESGELLGVDEREGKRELTMLDLGSGERTPVARLDRSFVDAVWLDGDFIVWLESEHVDVDGTGGYRPEQATVRCFDRAAGTTNRIRLPAANPAGMPYPTTWGLGEVSLGSGRIALSMHLETTGPSGSFIQVNDLYQANGCTGRLELLSEGAGYPEFAGDWLYYLHHEAGADGIWRQKVYGSEPQLVAAPAGIFALAGDAVVWDENRIGSTSTSAKLHAARPDGSQPRSVPTPDGSQLRLEAARSAVLGDLVKTTGLSYDIVGWWMYLPSWGAIVTAPAPPADPATTVAPAPQTAVGDQLLFVERSTAGDPTGKVTVVRLPPR